ncbi:MAG: O-antigen ligase family protein [Vicinamibacteria bacterium]|nr:O-antigen ligase family protein [Vicinamibacteria bacterium]
MGSLLRAQVALLAATAASATISVFAAQVGLALVGLLHLVRTVRRETRGFALPIDAAVGAFAIWTFMSAAFAPSPIAATESAKKLVLFLLLYFAAEALRTDSCRELLLDAMLMGGVALASLALLQFAFLGYDTMDTRPRSFLGHYMTASGVMAILLVVAVERILALGRPPAAARRALALCAAIVGISVAVMLSYRTSVMPMEVERFGILAVGLLAARRAWRGAAWPDPTFSTALALVLVPLSGLALILSRTRSAWIGVVCGLGVLAAIRRPRLLLFLPGVLGLLLLFSPRAVLDRLTISDASSRDRYYMWQAGLDMIMDKPIFGQGTGMILSVYPKFRWQGAPNPNAPHLHNNFVQIAAERGLPCLVFLGWILYLLGREAWRARGESRYGPLVLAALATTLSSGMFEYTLGDSEILMLVLLLSALPFSIRPLTKESGAPEPADAASDASSLADAGIVLEQ